MRMIQKQVDNNTQFIIVDAPEQYHDVIRAFAFAEVEEGLMKAFPSDHPHLDTSFENYQQHLDLMVKQSAKEIPVPWEDALEAFLQHTQEIESDWWIAGSLPLALRGLPIEPGDIDLIVDAAGSLKWGDMLQDVLIEPVSATSGWFCENWGRAFLHARIEWTGGIDPENSFEYVQYYYLPCVNNLETINWRGYELRIPPIAPQIAMDEARGRTERVRIMREALDQ